MSAAVEPAGTLEVTLNHATQLLRKNPSLAAEQALEILEAVPGHPHARLILGAARRQLGQDQAALEVLEALAREQPGSTPVHLELGIARGQAGNAAAAVSALRQAVRLSPESRDAWRLLGWNSAHQDSTQTLRTTTDHASQSTRRHQEIWAS
jgi:Flp pilus assembly protein TadD